jgi:hypothetical protein
VTEWWGKEIAGSDEAVRLAGPLAAGSQRWNRPSKGRFCVFRQSDACQTESCAIDKPLAPWLRGDKRIKK